MRPGGSKPKSVTILALILIFNILFIGSIASAEIPVIDVIVDNYSSTSAVELINGSGLSGDYHGTDPDHMWDYWQPSFPILLNFELNGVYSISSVDIWQYNDDSIDYSGESRLLGGVKDFDIYSSMDGVSFTLISPEILPVSPGGGPILPTRFPVSVMARHMRFVLNSNYGHSWEVGLSEVQFDGVPDADTDADGMPDAWETYYSLDPNSDDALLDADGDGVNNLDEYTNHTSPQNNPPNPPVLVSPSDGEQNVSVRPILIIQFSDPDAVARHTATRFQVYHKSDFNIDNPNQPYIDYLLDESHGVSLTQCQAPIYPIGHSLYPRTTYYFRAKVWDDQNESSEWSATHAFITGDAPVKSDGGGGGGGCFIATTIN